MKSTVQNMQGAVQTRIQTSTPAGMTPSTKQRVRTIVEVPDVKYLTAVLVSGEVPQTEILTRRQSQLGSTARLQQWWQRHTKTTVHLRTHAELSLFSLMKESAAPSPLYQRATFKEANSTFSSENQQNVLSKWYSGFKWLRRRSFFSLLCSFSIRIHRQTLFLVHLFTSLHAERSVTHAFTPPLISQNYGWGRKKRENWRKEVQSTQIA